VTTYDPLERVRKARRQAASVSALVVLAGVLVSIVVLRVWFSRDSTAAPPTSSSVASGSGPDLRWEPFRPGQDLPESLSAGPTKHVENRVGGFARNQLGAALAAIHLGARVDPAIGSTTFEPTIREQVVGTASEQLLENTKNTYEGARRRQGKSPGEALDPGSAHLVAYKVESQSPDAATVAVISADGPELYSARFELHWVDDDWHLVAPPGGDYTSLFTRLPALPVGAVALSRGT
jgi:hypothetical protein